MSIITITADSNEKNSRRMTDLMGAVLPDSRFTWGGYASLPVDLVFECKGERLLVEIKEPQDFVQSVLSGHLMEQVLSIRELRENGCIVILGDLEAIRGAIKESVIGRGVKKSEISNVLKGTYAQCMSFGKRSLLSGVPVFFQGDDWGFFKHEDQWADLLELAADYLTDGSLMGFRQKPADGERELLAASLLFHGDGIGPGVLKPVMQDYHLCLLPKVPDARPISTFSGIGPKRLSVLDKKVKMVYV